MHGFTIQVVNVRFGTHVNRGKGFMKHCRLIMKRESDKGHHSLLLLLLIWQYIFCDTKNQCFIQEWLGL